jgi:hypothetical protein
MAALCFVAGAWSPARISPLLTAHEVLLELTLDEPGENGAVKVTVNPAAVAFIRP